ncbi:hypothetical protein CR513_56106, partial [Mucuna pruriens]
MSPWPFHKWGVDILGFLGSDKTVIHLSGTSSNKWAGGIKQLGDIKGTEKKTGGGQRKMGKGAPTSIMVISYHTSLHNSRNTLLVDVRH